jgi:large subunit ribosomal protein L4
MPTVNVLSRNGEVVGNFEMAEDLINAKVNDNVLHQVVVAQLANMRSGTASTKSRSEIAGSGRKLYRQKGTGRARAGDRKSPTRVHGGVAFGPKHRSFRQSTPKKVRWLALHSALADKFQNNNVVIIDDINFEQPRTKEMAGLLQSLGLNEKTLIVLDVDNKNVYYSARNIPQVNVCTWNLLNTYDILWHDKLLMTQSAAQRLEEKFRIG